MGVMSERKKLLWHDYVSCLQCGGGGARLSMHKGREVGNVFQMFSKFEITEDKT